LGGSPILLKILQELIQISKNITDDRFVILRIVYEELSYEVMVQAKTRTQTDRHNKRASSMAVHVLVCMVIQASTWQL
jgi:hypothetical protein